MSWSTALTDLRALLSDQPDDRYCYRKKVFGNIDGVNTSFKTFEFRRVTNFTNSDSSANAPLGVYVNGVRLADAGIVSDDTLSGEFTLAVAPTDSGDTGAVVQATYYFQWFTDDELTAFLVGAARWLQIGSDYTQIPDGLNQGALYYAGTMALRKMAMRWSTRASNAFLLEDAPKKEALAIADSYSNMSMAFEKAALNYRNDYYTKSGQSLAAFSVSSFGRISGVTPDR